MASAAGFGRLLKEITKPSLTSGALTGGMALLSGANPIQALATAATDVVASAVPLGFLRKISPKSYAKRTLIDEKTGEKITQQGSHPLENYLNIGASIGAGYLTSPLIYGTGQQQQVAQQIDQRALVNNLETPQLLSPGTNFQLSGLPSHENFEQLLQQRGSWRQYLSPEDQMLIQETLGAVA